jgi:hypothetical protein
MAARGVWAYTADLHSTGHWASQGHRQVTKSGVGNWCWNCELRAPSTQMPHWPLPWPVAIEVQRPKPQRLARVYCLLSLLPACFFCKHALGTRHTVTRNIPRTPHSPPRRIPPGCSVSPKKRLGQLLLLQPAPASVAARSPVPPVPCALCGWVCY